jgi:uncharacterized membrane protein
MTLWKYNQNGQNYGPVDAAALRALLNSGTLSPESLVCREEKTEWAPARTFPELVAAAPGEASAPPISPSVGVPPLGSPPPVMSADSDTADIEKNKVFAVLAYIGILFLVPLLAAPQSRFARYHTNQGVVLFIAAILASAASVFLMFIPFVGCFAAFLPLVVGVGTFVLMVLGIVNAASGQYKPLPLIGHFELIK